ncbi:hypothetical protein BVG16_05770 [Paenibacillus selenitireducens]|uniref:Chitin-binding type-3 domain-containing protein n=1 Tax=Paenibacillus selenitireducens TaxID=1324314 RepID=A0A1T2XK44_9BACL|nr:carbohydrate-binding protein [Paenibacillus selenitireducens]OPA80247.1 hypothetical protein BVG16_05770 [Paenibacillus selenitireducens]
MNVRKQEEGFTLIEVLASFVLLVIMATVLVSLFSNGFRSIDKFGERSEQMHLARQEVEQATAGTGSNLTIHQIKGTGQLKIEGETVEKQISGTSGSKMILFIPTPTPWKTGVSYTLDDQVRYNGKNYRCVIPHTSNASNKPTSTSSPWVTM